MMPSPAPFTAARFKITTLPSAKPGGVVPRVIYSSPFPDITFPTESFHDFMTHRMSLFPTKKAFICGVTGNTLTYAQVLDRIDHFSRVLYHEHGVRPGQTVAMLSPNTIDYGAWFLAVLKLGARISTINPTYSSEEILMQMALSGATLLITVKMFQKNGQDCVDKHNSNVENNRFPFTGVPGMSQADTGAAVRKWGIVVSESAMMANPPPLPTRWEDAPEYAQVAAAAKDIHSTIVVPFSSGTTGLPKGVQLTNRNLTANVLQLQSLVRFEESDVMMSVLPYFHIYGMVAILFALLHAGGTQVVMPKFELLPYLQLMEKYRATHLFVAPPMIVGFAKHPVTASVDRSSVKFVLSGAAPLGKEVQQSCEVLFPNAFIGQGYGLTETSPVITIVPPMALPTDRRVKVEKLYGCAGKIIPNTSCRLVKIADEYAATLSATATEHDFEDVPVGEEGELWVKGPQVMKGYLRDEDTRPVLVKCDSDAPNSPAEYWFRTGDVAKVDPTTEGLYITDRLKELIKYKGFQVAPAELEALILAMPMVQDVIVMGVPHREGDGEVPRAHVVLKPSVDAATAADAQNIIIQHVERHVAPYKSLKGGVMIVAAVPKSPSGKLLRRVAKQDALKAMGLLKH